MIKFVCEFVFISGTVCSSCTRTYWYMRVIWNQCGKEFPIERKLWASDLNSEICNRFSSLLIFSSPDGSTIWPSLEIVHVLFLVFFLFCNNFLGGKRCGWSWWLLVPFAEMWLGMIRGIFSGVLFPSAVIYDGCPKTITQGIWWPRTKFNLPAAVSCPKGSVGA